MIKAGRGRPRRGQIGTSGLAPHTPARSGWRLQGLSNKPAGIPFDQETSDGRPAQTPRREATLFGYFVAPGSDLGGGRSDLGRGSFDPGAANLDPGAASHDPGPGRRRLGGGSFDLGRGSFDQAGAAPTWEVRTWIWEGAAPTCQRRNSIRRRRHCAWDRQDRAPPRAQMTLRHPSAYNHRHERRAHRAGHDPRREVQDRARPGPGDDGAGPRRAAHRRRSSGVGRRSRCHSRGEDNHSAKPGAVVIPGHGDACRSLRHRAPLDA